ncbi:NlpC/P60 family protein [Falsihalocynthiibacter sp. BN13B15]|uniref:C40 family peptidase n=1 Tax=Falsihalocynthiibacter sp. BN13B15 TaxID=3240871 RepID=UPI003510C679
MTDRRTYFANERVAHVGLRGQVDAAHFVEVAARRVLVPVVDVCAAPRGTRVSQLLMGAGFDVLETLNGWCFGRVVADGNVGYVAEVSLGEAVAPSHWVTARSSHIYTESSLKSADKAAVSFGSSLSVVAELEGYVELSGGGFVPVPHVSPLSERPLDAAKTALTFLGVPYLWGGDSVFGIDCSGLVQACLRAVGTMCPRDSDQQEAFFTADVAPKDLRRGDLVFWRGHVAMMLNEREMIHANAHHMAVAIEPFEVARSRIGAREFGEITSMKRP